MFSRFFKNGKNAAKLHTVAFGTAGGVVWGGKILLGTWLAMMCGAACPELQMMTNACPNYSISFVGSLVGFVWGFVRGFIAFSIMSWIYNKLVK